MSNIIDNVGHAFEQTKNFIEEHPWQAAAAAAAWTVGGPIVGAAVSAGELALDKSKGAPAGTHIGEAAVIGAAVGAIAGMAIGEPGGGGMVGARVGAAAGAALGIGAEGAVEGLGGKGGKTQTNEEVSKKLEKLGEGLFRAGTLGLGSDSGGKGGNHHSHTGGAEGHGGTADAAGRVGGDAAAGAAGGAAAVGAMEAGQAAGKAGEAVDTTKGQSGARSSVQTPPKW